MVLAATLAFSPVDGMSFASYAAESDVVTDAFADDVSKGDVSLGDVSLGDVSKGDIVTGDVSNDDVSDSDVPDGMGLDIYEINSDEADGSDSDEPYTGEISESDEEGTRLDIYASENNLDEAGILNVLQTRVNDKEKFDILYIYFGVSQTSVSADIWNAAKDLLNEGGAFAVCGYGEENKVVDVNWTFHGLQQTTEAVTLDSSHEILGSSGKGIKIKLGNNKFPAEKADLWLLVGAKSPYDDYRNAVGTDAKVLFTDADGNEVEDVAAGIDYFGATDENKGINIWMEDVKNLTVGAYYTIKTVPYHGEINTFTAENGREYTEYIISAAECGLDVFTSEELSKHLDYYVQHGAKVDYITVEQKYSEEGNVIKKELINAAVDSKISKKSSLLGLTFTYDRSVEKDGKTYQSQISWILSNPGKATKDIDAKVAFTTVPSQGVKVKFGDNTYSAGEVVVSYQMALDKEVDLSQQLVAALGELAKAEEDKDIVALKNGTVKDDVAYSNYYKYPADDEDAAYQYQIGLDINGVQEYAPDVEYLLAPVNDLRGESDANYFALSDNTGNKNKLLSLSTLSHTVDTGTSVTWKSYDEGALSITGSGDDLVVKALKESSEVYYSAAYVSGGVEVLDVFCNGVKSAADLEIPEKVWEYLDARAVTNFDTTLADVKLELRDEDGNIIENLGSFEWTEESKELSLTPFKNMDGHEFAAIYTEAQPADGSEPRQVECSVWVRMVTIEGVDVIGVQRAADGKSEQIDYLPAQLGYGESVWFNYDYVIKNGDAGDIEDYLDRIQYEWTSSPAGIGKTVADGTERLNGCYQFSAVQGDKNAGKGKKTFTVTLKDSKANKVIAKASHSLTVVEKPVADFDNLQVEWVKDATPTDSNAVETGTLRLRYPADETYYALTVKSLDTALCTLKKATVKDETVNEVKYKTITIPYAIKSVGRIYLSVAAADEIKSSTVLERYILDISPAYTGETMTLNKNLAAAEASFVVQLAKVETEDGKTEFTKCTYTGMNNFEDEGISVYELNSQKLWVASEHFVVKSVVPQDDGKVVVTVGLKDNADVAKGTYKNVQVGHLTISGGTGEDAETGLYAFPLTITVTDALPAVTFKQTKKNNLFYNDDASNGILTVSADAQLSKIELADCDYELKNSADGTYYEICLKEGKDGTDKKGTLKFWFEGYDADVYVSKAFTVSTENKAPTLVQSSKSTTWYTYFGSTYVDLSFTDKTTGNAIEISEVKWSKAKNDEIAVTADGIKTGTDKTKNNVELSLADSAIHFELVDAEEYKSATDKFTLTIKAANWSKPVTVKNYSITVNTKEPKLALDSRTLQLNINEEVYDTQTGVTTLRLSKSALPLEVDPEDVAFEGVDAKAKELLSNYLDLEYRSDAESGEIIASFDIDDIQALKDSKNKNKLAGTYKFTVKVYVADEKELTVPLSIKIADTPVAKCVKVTAKGSIDLLDRKGTVIAYTPKFTNLSGAVEDAWLTGRDAYLFDAEWKNGTLYVCANDEKAYATKYKYEVVPTFLLQNRYGDEYEVTAAKQSISLKQGKPKLTLSSAGNVLYRDNANSLQIDFSAVLNKQNVTISRVELTNYTLDLDAQFDAASQRVTLSQSQVKQIVTKGKSYSLNFAVYYKDAAGNEKPVKVTYKVIVK
jgi:hypothetical protein